MTEAIPRLLEPALTRRVHDPSVVKEIIDAAVKRETEAPPRYGAGFFWRAFGPGARQLHPRSRRQCRRDKPRAFPPRPFFPSFFLVGKRARQPPPLAALARLSQNPALVEQIVLAVTPEQVIEAIRSGI